ncbi:MAG: acyltransferase [Phycisphaerales bacterium]|nr:MAG: acyltransferase [Phycisphaerales bacterium]
MLFWKRLGGWCRSLYIISGCVRRPWAAMMTRTYLSLHGVKAPKNLCTRSLPFCRRHPKAVIELGNDLTICNKLRENAAGISHRTVLVANQPGARLVVGNHVGISGAVLFCSKEIIIEDYVNIGTGARIYDTDFHALSAKDRRRNTPGAVKAAPVRICEDVWVGSNVIILKGVTVGARSILATGSVVTKDIPPDTVAAGVPARPVRTLPRT